ncbi:alpha/beta hydrolase [Sporosarcina koreensis]|uniref:alpha/beta hydrolase n=1 Tax=Sporosarcina koreensis TaxID=334735 RepID=UPI00075D6E1B|nr:alpha/beta hydrolase [Sporosarcina koreensis]
MVDPQVEEVLSRQANSGNDSTETTSVAEARRMFSESRTNFKEIVKEVASVTDVVLDSPNGKIPIRIYTPEGNGPFPVLVFFHGGGFVLGDLNTTHNICNYLANGAECIVVSVDYRLAPEHKFPAAVEDAYFATQWVEENAYTFMGDPSRIAVGGESAGGNLAAVVSIMARENKTPALKFQLLIYPCVQFGMETKSMIECGEKYNLTVSEMKWFGDHYFSDKSQMTNIFASPLLAENLEGLPPALVITAEFDPLRDEGEEYADRLASSGVPVRKKCYPGMVHSFFNYSGEVDQSQIALDKTVMELREIFYSSVMKS